MKNLAFLLILSIIILFIPLNPAAYGQYRQEPLTCGIIVTHMAVSPAAILEGVRPLANYMTKRIGVPVKVDVISDEDTMIRRLQEGSLQLGYVSNLEYIKIKQKLNITPFAKVIKGGSSKYNAILLVREDAGINSLSDLKGKTFSYTSKDSSHGYLFPGLLIKKNFHQSLENFFGHLNITKKDPDGILSVLYKKSDVVGASSQTFMILSDLMPRLKRELKILDKSDPLVHGPFFYYDKNFKDKSLIERCKKEILNMDRATEGKQVLLLFKIGGWTTASDADYNNLRQLYNSL
jgi:phosphonate transport system substrate-binding protein